ncbi:innexin unc-9-like [Artemia franciscana]|uniref:Innexin n=1 Tax=Artemia franciscana TaxID=6661 RepID=A0AA88I547_ARTSF|nr:hypothetical protein QYM36_004292 [Artemia franciscana]
MAFVIALCDQLFGGKEPIDDVVDKLNRKYTIVVLMVLTVPIFTKQFVGEPIECFSPTFFTEAQSRYVNSYCWTSSTYYETYTNGAIGDDDSQINSNEVKVNYYQWAPLILLGEAFLFYLPFLLWRFASINNGVSLSRVAKKLGRVSDTPLGHPDRQSVLSECCELIQILTQIDRGNRPTSIIAGSTLTILYLMSKVLYIVNVLMQFLLLQLFLGEGYWSHGFNILRVLFRKNEWWSSPHFPLQTLCKVKAANQGVLQQYNCQCVLPINVFNEKIFSLWWFFCAVLLPTTVIGVFKWFQLMRLSQRIIFFRQYLERTKKVPCEVSFEIASNMVNQFLTVDSFTILKLMENNFGPTVITAVISRLYDMHKKINRMKLHDQLQKSGEKNSPEVLPQVHNITNARLEGETSSEPLGKPGFETGSQSSSSEARDKATDVVYVWTSEQPGYDSRQKFSRQISSRRSIQFPVMH